MNGFLVDTSVLLDVAEDDPVWADWSQRQLDTASSDGFLAINPVIYAEFSLAYDTIEQLEAMLRKSALAVVEIPRPALFLAAWQFRAYRRRGGARTGVLPDFFIGAHAAVDRLTLITRDQRRRSWFPSVPVIAPEQ
jgi:predicted nucleic acid-binding protein